MEVHVVVRRRGVNQTGNPTLGIWSTCIMAASAINHVNVGRPNGISRLDLVSAVSIFDIPQDWDVDTAWAVRNHIDCAEGCVFTIHRG